MSEEACLQWLSEQGYWVNPRKAVEKFPDVEFKDRFLERRIDEDVHLVTADYFENQIIEEDNQW